MLYASILAIGRMVWKRLRKVGATAKESPELVLVVAATLLVVIISLIARS